LKGEREAGEREKRSLLVTPLFLLVTPLFLLVTPLFLP